MKPLEQLTVGALLRRTAKRFPSREALRYHGQTWLYEDLDSQVDQAARWLLGWGVKKGDHLGIWCEAEPNTVILMYAAVRIGAVAALINTSLSQQEVKGLLERTDIQWLAISDGHKEQEFPPLCLRFRDELPMLQGIVYTGLSGNSAGFPSLGGDAAEPVSKEALAAAEEQVLPEDPAYIIFTSGTTSFPKAVMDRHIARVNMSFQHISDMAITEEDRICSALPLFHCFGLSANMLAACSAGACLILPDTRRNCDVLSAVDGEKCTILSCVPSAYKSFLKCNETGRYDVSTLRTGIIGGSTYSLALFQEVEERFGMTLTACFGQSEATCGIASTCVTDPANIRPTSGRFIQNTEGTLINISTGAVCEPGELGEIRVRGYLTMLGYYGQPEATAKILDEDGWLRTGDIGYLDENGSLHVTGRLKEMIIRGGENISPAEIEAALAEQPDISLCKAVGVPDEDYGEAICLCLVLQPGSELSEAYVKELLKPKLAYFKIPKYVLFLDSMPTTATGKVRLEELKKLAKELLGL